MDTDLLDLARRQQVTPILWARLADVLGDEHPLSAALHHDYYRTLARQAALEALAVPFCRALAAEGVRVLALKGWSLAADLYGDPGHRPMRDIDLLIPRADVETALRVAGDLGLHRFEDVHSLPFALRFGSAVVLTRPGADLRQPTIDLHWRLFDAWQVSGREDAWLDTVWRIAEPVTIAGLPLERPSPAHALVHLASHLGVHHAFGGLLWHCDVALFVRRFGPRMDWDESVRAAENLGVAGALALALDAARAHFDVVVPAEVDRRLAGRSPRRRLARSLALGRALRLEPMIQFEHLMPLLLMNRGRDCAGAVARGLWPSPEWIALRYAAPSATAGYARHGLHALGLLAGGVRRHRGGWRSGPSEDPP